MGQLGIIRDVLFYQFPETGSEERAGCHSCLSLGSSYLQSSPQQFPTQLSPGSNPKPSYNPDFSHYAHLQTLNLALHPALIPTPEMLTLLPVSGRGRSAKVLPLSGAGYAFRDKNSFWWGARQGEIQSTPGRRNLPLSQLPREPRPVTHPQLADPLSQRGGGAPAQVRAEDR